MQVSNSSLNSPGNEKQQLYQDEAFIDFINKSHRDPRINDDAANDQYSSFVLSQFQNSEQPNEFPEFYGHPEFSGHPQKLMNISSISSIKGENIEEKESSYLTKNKYQTANQNLSQVNESYPPQNSYDPQQNASMNKNHESQAFQNNHNLYDSKGTYQNNKNKKCSKYTPKYAPKYLPKWKKKYSYEQKQSTDIQAQSPKDYRLTPTYEEMNIKPNGCKSWPSMSIFIKKKKIVLTHRDLLQQIADIIIIPYKQLKLDIYPGNFVNMLKFDYREKMKQLQQKGMLKGCFIQQCIGLRNFHAISFMKLSNTQSNISSSLAETFEEIAEKRRPIKSVLLPYSPELGHPKEVIELIIKEGENDKNKKLEEIYITMNSLESFVDGMVAFCQIIKELYKKNEIFSMEP